MSFSSYMDLCLTHDPHGYYMKRDVFNTKGDFITSPEISQMFGEMVGVWIAHFLEKTHILEQMMSPQNKGKINLSLLEFGPGRGTLMVDILRVFQQFGILDGITINFIEASPFNRKTQQENVMKALKKWGIWMAYQTPEKGVQALSDTFIPEESGEAKRIELKWFSNYENYIAESFPMVFSSGSPGQKPSSSGSKSAFGVPVIVLAHEFFDALPVNIFEYKGPSGWCEKLVNVSQKPGYILSLLGFDFPFSFLSWRLGSCLSSWTQKGRMKTSKRS